MFVVNLIYERPLAEIEAATQVHREYLEIYYQKGIFLASGPKVPRDGGIIIVRGQISRSDLQHILDADPFCQKQLVRYEIIEFTPVKHNPALADLL
ncbi:YciI family protein [Methylobacterium sp. A54F]